MKVKPTRFPAKLLIGFFSAVGFFLLANQSVLSDRLESESFVVTFGNFNVTSGEKSSSTYDLTDTVGQVANGPYGQYGLSGYFVGGGFQYIYQIDTFSFRITDVTVELGELAPNTHAIAAHDLIINTKGAGGYYIYAYEKNPLRHVSGSPDIPDTSCNAGTCSISSAAIWNNTAVPGFGYNMSGNDVPPDFIDTNYFRPFGIGFSQMQIVMSSSNIANNRTATVTYKAGASGSQAAGDYTTTVSYVAVPGY